MSFLEENVMPEDDKTRCEPRAGASSALGRARGKPATERPFDMWLQKQLHAMYDEIASEPLPEDLVNLIDHDAAGDMPKGDMPKKDDGTPSDDKKA
jgi:hypothetical protein